MDGTAVQPVSTLLTMEFCCRRYLQQNKISSLTSLKLTPALASLNVANNALSSLAGVEHCLQLSTLLAAGNTLDTLEALQPLRACTDLTTLDLQQNNLQEAEGLITFLQASPSVIQRCC